MKKSIILAAFIIFSSLFLKAQTKHLCEFEKLFSVKSGMDMPAAIAALQKNSVITLVSQTTDKFPPYAASGGDSIRHETVIYHIDTGNCLNGRDNAIKFEFADGKLYKAYLETSYGKNEFADMMANFDFLHKQILQSWKHEKQITIQGNGVEGVGYNFYKTPEIEGKLDMCMLQYVKTNSRNPDRNMYSLEILWVDLNNTRMENTMY